MDNNLWEHYKYLSDEELLDSYSLHQNNYTQEAQNIIKHLLKSRGFTDEDIGDYRVNDYGNSQLSLYC